MSGGEGLNELTARVRELKDSHLVQGGRALREAPILIDPLEPKVEEKRGSSFTSARRPRAMGSRVEPGGLCSGKGKNNGNKKNRKLNNVIKEKDSPINASPPKVHLTELVNNIVELLKSQFQQGLVTKVFKEVGEITDDQNDVR
ncbi:hypothetical protein PVK06_029914 [Gossypium arboreum]|uniref:Uncharacterized protein n=1 Tax=Gossypium arboreum TaxID=29729 RepID=A0ABR0NPB1_GOSAR|nr:hypothetical protein PVK06_029914 [Gossypium arboreum]